jgi:MFS family permease
LKTKENDIENRSAVFGLLIARIVYAINWFNIASIFSYMVADFKQGISSLGLISAGFFVGVGAFQVPGGILAAKLGPRKTAIYGIMISSGAALLCGVTSNLQQIEALRFVVGVGMALFFSSSVTLITRYLGKGSEGLAVGLLNSAHSVGGFVGLFGWVILAEIIGWRQSLVISGGVGLASGLLLILWLPKEDNLYRSFQIKIADVLRVLLDRHMFGLGVVLLGAQIAWAITLTFIVFYLEDHLKVNSALAGLAASMSLVFALIAAPIFGRIYDRTNNVRRMLLSCGLAMSVSIVGIAFSTTLYLVIISVLSVGVFSAAVFTITYTAAQGTIAKKRSETDGVELEFDKTLAISWVNGISLFGAFWVPIIFSIIVHQAGYASAWLISGMATLLFILPALGIKKYKDTKTDRPG